MPCTAEVEVARNRAQSGEDTPSFRHLLSLRSRSSDPKLTVGHGVRIVVQGGWLARAAAALHQLQRGLPELHQLLAGHGRERLHRCHERCELLPDGVVRGRHALRPEQLLELRRRRGAKGPQHQEPGCMP